MIYSKHDGVFSSCDEIHSRVQHDSTQKCRGIDSKMQRAPLGMRRDLLKKWAGIYPNHSGIYPRNNATRSTHTTTRSCATTWARGLLSEHRYLASIAGEVRYNSQVFSFRSESTMLTVNTLCIQRAPSYGPSWLLIPTSEVHRLKI